MSRNAFLTFRRKINEAITGSGAEGFYLHIETSVNNALEAGTATFFYTTP